MSTRARHRGPHAPGGTRVLAAAHLMQAVLLLAQPPAVLRALAGRSVPPTWIVRVLGVRTLAQAGAEGLRPTRAVLRAGVAVDFLHAASMLAAARVWPRYRRAALVSAGSAGASALAGALLAESRR